MTRVNIGYEVTVDLPDHLANTTSLIRKRYTDFDLTLGHGGIGGW